MRHPIRLGRFVSLMTKKVDVLDSSKSLKDIPVGYEELKEGLARALYRKGEVFYNSAQVVNRDLSVLTLRYFVERRTKELKEERAPRAGAGRLRSPTPTFTVLEALSATGLRAVRYWKEVEGLEQVVANDLDPGAVRTIRLNVLHNDVDPDREVVPNQGDAVAVMVAHRDPSQQFDIVDLDPYGSAAPFLDSAVQAVADGGLLCVTCTDLAVLCGNSPEICFGRYGGTPVKSAFMHEMAVRIVLSAIQAAANRHGRVVEPIVCAKIDFYVRLFVRVWASKARARRTPSSSALVYHCNGCGTFVIQPLGRVKEKPHLKFQPALGPPVGPQCSVCGSSMSLGGPIWGEALLDKGASDYILKEVRAKFRNEHLKARSRIDALITVLAEEVPRAPLFMHLAEMCKVLKCASPPTASVRIALENKGYLVSQSHTDPQAIKTNAPCELLWDIMRLWVRKKGRGGRGKKRKDERGGDANQKSGVRATVADKIMETQPTLIEDKDIDFSVKRDRFVKRGTGNNGPRFLPNPEPNWGPKSRAGKRKRFDVTNDIRQDRIDPGIRDKEEVNVEPRANCYASLKGRNVNGNDHIGGNADHPQHFTTVRRFGSVNKDSETKNPPSKIARVTSGLETK